MQLHIVTFHDPHPLSTNRRNIFEMQVQNQKQCAEFSVYSLYQTIESVCENYRYLRICVFVSLEIRMLHFCQVQGNSTVWLTKRILRWELIMSHHSFGFNILKFSILSPEIEEQCFYANIFSVNEFLTQKCSKKI
jgi:hypothetical protein